MVDVINQEVEKGEVLLLCPPSEPIAIAQLLGALLGVTAMGFEPSSKNVGVESNLGCDIEDQLNDAGFRVSTQPDAVGASYAHKQIGEAGREATIFDKGLLLTLDKGCEEQNSLLDDPFAKGACSNFGNGDIHLLRGSKRYAWMGQWTAGFVTQDVGQFL